MLEKLIIKDFVLIEDAELGFTSGLNIITGETGSGKSLIFKALSLIAGERTAGNLVYIGKKKAVIEAVFTNFNTDVFHGNDNLKEYFSQDELIIRREISSAGKSRSFLNDSPINLSDLKAVTGKILELSSQHSSFALLEKANHINILDSYSNTLPEKEEYKIVYKALKESISELFELKSKEKEIVQNLEFWKFQLSEIKKVSPKSGEMEKLISELNIIENAEMIWESSSKAHHLIYGGTNSAYNNLLESLPDIEKLSEFLPDLQSILEEINQSCALLKEVALVVNDFKNNTEYDPNRINYLRSRIASLRGLEKKYLSIENAIGKWEELEQLINSSANLDKVIEIKKQEILKHQLSLGEKAELLSNIRKENAEKLSSGITKEISKLGMESAEFSVGFDFCKAGDGEHLVAILADGNKLDAKVNGCDNVEFLARTNKGHRVGSLVLIASGGELSRIMLAIKSLVVGNDRSTIILDEIDTGISGRISMAVGGFMKKMGKQNQIIAISHSPQIAAQADTHFSVNKTHSGEMTRSVLKKLNKEEIQTELASLFSGEHILESSLKSAKELIGKENEKII